MSRARLVLHNLRHYFASGLIAANFSIATVQTALAHSSPSIKLNEYTHLWPREEDRTRRAAQGLVDDVFGDAEESVTNCRAGSA
ncbi:tyrosine-type recombinase/integrase [Frigoribacterium sp. ACAM 257]|uniref:tyrosine-type recombinase/integrase n=1 Tax=Frigoribacterium sp. ACAM 257 TaxID=2508998 RepID=UPI0011B9B5C6|nr:tyrosine-type recombinase/integrase [Frigoribacterium sp. ACAM 257]TWX37133.1 tyrosine-type recombinase/integrase [Frigoribacterium sp. ACAM 257]